MVLALSGWALALLALGEYERAIALCEESLALARELGSPQSVAGSLTTLAIAVLERGDYERARGLCEESLAIRQQRADKGGSAHTLTILGHVALRDASYERRLADVRVQLEAAPFEKAVTEGRAFTFEQAIAAVEQVQVREQITPTAQSPTGGTPPTLPQAPASRGNPSA